MAEDKICIDCGFIWSHGDNDCPDCGSSDIMGIGKQNREIVGIIYILILKMQREK